MILTRKKLKLLFQKNVSEIETYQKELEEKWTPIVQKVYQSQQAAQPTSENTASHNETKADDIEDTDFEEVK